MENIGLRVSNLPAADEATPGQIYPLAATRRRGLGWKWVGAIAPFTPLCSGLLIGTATLLSAPSAIAQIIPFPIPTAEPSPTISTDGTSGSGSADPSAGAGDSGDSGDQTDEQALEDFPPSPLEPTAEPDPLLPQLIVDRPYSPLERLALRQALDDLQRQGEVLYQAKQTSAAFEIWYRELRLRRVLGVEEEVPALARVGQIAWQENRGDDVRIITERLQAIELEVQLDVLQPVNFELLFSIAQAYQSMRVYTSAVALYTQLLTQVRSQQDVATEQIVLTGLADLHIAWFNFAEAAIAYEDLLKIARAANDPVAELNYLQQLAYVYQKGDQPAQAIAIQQQLLERYQLDPLLLSRITLLKIELGDNYRAIDRPDIAVASYQDAFTLAQSQQQYGFASESLYRLADLYTTLNRPLDALTVYQLLLTVNQQSYDVIGNMNVYDQIGQIYRTGGQQEPAIAAFQQALQLAQQLSYGAKATYFAEQIQLVSQPPAETQLPADGQPLPETPLQLEIQPQPEIRPLPEIQLSPEIQIQPEILPSPEIQPSPDTNLDTDTQF